LQINLPATIDDGKGHSITISSPSALTINDLAPLANTAPINITYSGDTANFKIGDFTSNIIVTGTSVNSTNNTLSQTIPLKFTNTFCTAGEAGNSLSISSVKIDNSGSSSGDETTWIPLDTLTIKVRVENTNTINIRDVQVELGLIDSAGKNIISSMDDLNNKKISLGTINEGKDKTAEFKFSVPTDFKEGNYLLVTKAYIKSKESANCTSSTGDFDSTYYQIVSGERESDSEKEVVLENIILSPETAQCGDKVQISGKAVNIGVDDFLDQYKIILINKELGLNIEKVVREDLDSGDESNFDIEFDVPVKATEKTYSLKFDVYYDYDDSDNTYGTASDKTFTAPLTVAGNCQAQVVVPSLQISAELDSTTPEAVAGKQIVVKSTLRNTGNSTATYNLAISGNSAWSSLVSINPQTLTLNKGESKDVSITLNIDQAAEGDKEFTISANSGSSASVNQKVALTVTKPAASTRAISDHLKKNWFIYVIIIVNVILLIAIIMVIKSMVSPKRDYE
jgi:hypothetical protein